jgi:hypothetical protein
MEEYFTEEKLAKYYPSNFDYCSVSDDHDASNDFASRLIRTPSILSLSDDECGTDHQIVSCNPPLDLSFSSQLFSSLLPQMNEDTISLSGLSLNMDETDNAVSEKIAVTSIPYQTKPIHEWTQQDVLQFFKEKNLTNLLPLLGEEVNGRRLQELCSINKPKSAEMLESLKRKLNYLPTTSIRLADYERLESELQKLLPSSTNSGVLFSNIMQSN